MCVMRLANVLSACSLAFWMGLLTIVVTGEALSRGFDWRLPLSHFDGVNEQGYVLFCEKIGVLDVGENLQIPIHIMFKSEWMANSPYLGRGWMLPLLESHIEQTSERSYRLRQPDGWYRDFVCSKSSESVLNGTRGWKAEIRGDTITAWSPCGWKLIFTKNKLTAIVTPKNIRLDLVIRNGQADEVLANGFSVLRVERDAMTGRVKGLSLRGGKKIEIEQQLRPRVQQIDEKNVVKGEDYSLSKVTQADGTVKTYEYGVNDQMCPTLKTGNRLIVWDPGSQLIVKDGEWTYDIKPNEENPWTNAAIGRTNANGEKEFWHYDEGKGQEIIQAHGYKTISSWFVSGAALRGKIRKIEIESVDSGKSIEVYKFAYNERGRILRVTRYDSEGKAEVHQALE